MSTIKSRKSQQPNYLICYRIDRVVRVPSWAEEYIQVGDLVRRDDDGTTSSFNHPGNSKNYMGNLRLGKSYTKFSHYAPCPYYKQYQTLIKDE